ncbi:MAG: ubiquinol-cytochrome C chaperone [Xanthobacteraceae bacterium]|nr:ubiquinol-cytochrome C chaperone [Xanthobacteraceae bacterium]
MISLPFRRSSRAASIDALYGMIVAQARTIEFYRGYGVPDTVDGRLDMIVLHLVLVLRQLTRAQGALPPPGQQLFDRFCADMDDNFREMGVGDFGVPKRMQKVGEAFYGRAKVYESALADADPAVLEAAVARNVFGAAETPLGARRLAAYMREAADRLAPLAADAVVAAKFDFPDPASIATPAAQETLEQR